MEGCTACVPGGRCVCNDVANEQARRVTIQQTISYVADETLRGIDPPLRPITDAERLYVLGETIGGLERELQTGANPNMLLLALAAETQLWLEAIEREQA